MSNRVTNHDYIDAIYVQDACNLSGVVHSFVKVLGRIEESFKTTDGALSAMEIYGHPLVIMYASKCYSLTQAGADGLHKLVDLRTEHGSEVIAAVRAFEHVIGEVRLALETYKSKFSTTDINTAPLCKQMALRIAMLTACENLDVFGQAYEACKFVMEQVKGEEWKEHDETPLDEVWLHQNMLPRVVTTTGEPAPVDWACECGATGETKVLAFVNEVSKFKCPMCGSQNITAVSATLKAELKTPRMLAFAMGKLTMETLGDAGYVDKARVAREDSSRACQEALVEYTAQCEEAMKTYVARCEEALGEPLEKDSDPDPEAA